MAALADGLVTRSFLRKYRRHAIVVLLTLSAIITPTGDPFTLMIVFLPLFLLYEMITRRKPSENFLVKAEYVGFGILILLMVVANMNDILRWLGYM